MAEWSSVENASEEVFDFVCGPCNVDGEILQAKGYCSDCQDYLCDLCFKTHIRPKPFRHHVLLDEKTMPKHKKATTVTKTSDICTERFEKHQGCLDTLTVAKQSNIKYIAVTNEKTSTTKVYTKDDFSAVNRFECAFERNWGYSDDSVEAIRFMCDTDILLGGFGLFGGDGEYFGRIKVYSVSNFFMFEGDGKLLAETDKVTFECASREKYPFLLEEPILLKANSWYVAWACISGPDSDYGASGQACVTTEDQVTFKFKDSKKSDGGTDVNEGQIPQLLYRLPSRDYNTDTQVR